MNPNNYIPKPCHEDWNTMSGDEKRKFCEKCSTHVHDLTDKSDEEIRTLHRANGGKLCGSFRLRNSLALGSGIASLALASCNSDQSANRPGQPGPRVAGGICPPPEQADHGKTTKTSKPTKVTRKFATPPKKSQVGHQPVIKKAPEVEPVEKMVVPEGVPMLLGVVCPVPQRPRLPEA